MKKARSHPEVILALWYTTWLPKRWCYTRRMGARVSGLPSAVLFVYSIHPEPRVHLARNTIPILRGSGAVSKERFRARCEMSAVVPITRRRRDLDREKLLGEYTCHTNALATYGGAPLRRVGQYALRLVVRGQGGSEASRSRQSLAGHARGRVRFLGCLASTEPCAVTP